MRLQKRVITYEDFDINYNQLLTMKEAAAALGIKVRGLAGLIDRDTLTEIVDADAIERGRNYTIRFVLKDEVEELIDKRRLAKAEAE